MSRSVSPDSRPGTVLVANPSADLYGSDRMMLESVRGLVGLGWRVIVTCSDEGPLLDPLRAVGAEIVVLPVPVVRKSMLNPRGVVDLVSQVVRGLPAMRRLIGNVRPDVLLVNTVTIPFWLVAAKLSRLPTVVHVHEAEGSLARSRRLVLSAPLVLATRVVYNSEVSRKVSGLRYLERTRRVRVIYNGVEGPTVAEPPRTDLAEPFRVVYVGRLSPRKGVDLVVRAAKSLIEQGVPTEVDLVGAVFPGYEWYEAELRDLVAELDLTEQVTFQGFQSSVWPFLASGDVAIVPSRLDESFGNTLVEALLAARPVVASDHTGLREAADGFGAAVLAQTDDVAGFTESLRDIHDEWPAYRQRAEEDATLARERYNPRRFHGELAAVLAEVAFG